MDPASPALIAMLAPCKSCPYRCDVPSGVWDASEYEKLRSYDGEIIDQLQNGGTALFDCHQQNGALCSGWLATHGSHSLLALRLHGHRVDPSVWDYETDVPVFQSGREACEHGLRDIDQPGEKAGRVIKRLIAKQERTSTQRHARATTHASQRTMPRDLDETD